MYFEETEGFEDVPPLKNKLQALCHVVKQHNPSARIFISNLLPRISRSPVKKPRGENEFLLLQAVRSVNRVLTRVHFMTLYQHFVSKKGTVIQPAHRYLDQQENLTVLGCLTFRECMLCEARLKGNWFC